MFVLNVSYMGFGETVLNTIRDFFFNTLVSPLIKIMWFIISLILEVIFELLNVMMKHALLSLLRVVDFFENIFNIFSGVDKVVYNGEEMYLLDSLLLSDEVQRVFWLITIIGVALCFIFTIYSVGKSIGTHILENKRPVGAILKRALSASFSFMLVPLLMYIGLQLSSLILISSTEAITSARGVSGDCPMSTILFLSGTVTDDSSPGSTPFDGSNSAYIDGQKSIYDENDIKEFDSMMNNNPVKVVDHNNNYSNEELAEQIKQQDSTYGYNYLVVYLGAIFTILIMIISILAFVRRIFEVIILYITSPLFVSTIPLDDGNTFRKWRGMMVAKLLSAFGIVFTMKFVMLLAPTIMSSKVNLTPDAKTNTILKLFFIIAGLYAAYKSQQTLLEIINPEAAAIARQSTGAAIALGKQAVSLAAGVATGGASAAAQGAAAAGKGAAAAGKAAKGASSAAKGAKGASSSGNAFKGASNAGSGGMNTGGAKGGAGSGGSNAGGAKGGAGSGDSGAKGHSSSGSSKPDIPDLPSSGSDEESKE